MWERVGTEPESRIRPEATRFIEILSHTRTALPLTRLSHAQKSSWAWEKWIQRNNKCCCIWTKAPPHLQSKSGQAMMINADTVRLRQTRHQSNPSHHCYQSLHGDRTTGPVKSSQVKSDKVRTRTRTEQNRNLVDLTPSILSCAHFFCCNIRLATTWRRQ